MPTTQSDIQKVQAARDKAAGINADAASYGATANTLHDTVMSGVMEDRQKRGISEMAKSVGNVSGQLAAAPEQMKAYGGDMVNPMDMDYFTSQARAANLRQLGTISTSESENTRTLQEIIQAGANQLVSMGQLKKAEADKILAEASALMERLNFEEGQRQFNEEMAYKKSNSGSEGGLEDFFAQLLQQEQGGQEEQVDDGFIEDKEEDKFNAGEAIGAVLPEFVKNPVGWTTDKIRENFIKTSLEIAAKRWGKNKKGGSW